MDILDKVYYMRALVGVVAGIVTGIIIAPGTDQRTVVGIAILIAIVFYIISIGIGRGITGRNLPKDRRKKAATNGIFPFIFLLLMFMIIIYTALHQSIAS